MDDWDQDDERHYQERRAGARLLRTAVTRLERELKCARTGAEIVWEDSEVSILEDKILVTVNGKTEYEITFEVKGVEE